MKSIITVSTGINGLDEILNNLHLGDNVVWQVDSIDDYKHFLTPYINSALENNRKIIYFRFASHEPLIKNNNRIQVFNLNAYSGLSRFQKRFILLLQKWEKKHFMSLIVSHPFFLHGLQI